MSFLRRLLSLVFTFFTAPAPRSTIALDMGWVRQIWAASIDVREVDTMRGLLFNNFPENKLRRRKVIVSSENSGGYLPDHPH